MNAVDQEASEDDRLQSFCRDTGSVTALQPLEDQRIAGPSSN